MVPPTRSVPSLNPPDSPWTYLVKASIVTQSARAHGTTQKTVFQKKLFMVVWFSQRVPCPRGPLASLPRQRGRTTPPPLTREARKREDPDVLCSRAAFLRIDLDDGALEHAHL